MARDTEVGGGGAISGQGAVEDAKAPAHMATATLDDDFDHLITRWEGDSEYLSEHLRRLQHVTNDPRVVAALREANLPSKENGT
jgi:hypothetical protein